MLLVTQHTAGGTRLGLSAPDRKCPPSRGHPRWPMDARSDEPIKSLPRDKPSALISSESESRPEHIPRFMQRKKEAGQTHPCNPHQHSKTTPTHQERRGFNRIMLLSSQVIGSEQDIHNRSTLISGNCAERDPPGSIEMTKRLPGASAAQQHRFPVRFAPMKIRISITMQPVRCRHRLGGATHAPPGSTALERADQDCEDETQIPWYNQQVIHNDIPHMSASFSHALGI